jgi:REG-2-like HAD superfamily hydrolase
MPRRYDAVFLDVGATLVDPHPSFHEVVARICTRHGHSVSAADVERAEPAVWAELKARAGRGEVYGLTREEGLRYWNDVYHLFLRQLGADEPGEIPSRLVQEFLKLETWQLYPDALPALQELDRRGYLLGVVSNWEDWLEELLVSLQVSSLFKFAVVSGVEMVAKPDRRIYRRALELAGVEPRRVVHVGDSMENDVLPATEVGITAVLLDRRDRLAGRHEPRITSLSQLPDLLE